MLTLFKQRSVVAMFVAVASLIAASTPLPDITSQPHVVDGILSLIAGVSAVIAGISKPPAPAE
jgi:hypothetical protein